MEGDNLMFEGIPVANLTTGTLLGIAVLLIFLGRLVPLSVLKSKQVEADQWRQAYELEREARVKSDSQTTELLELAKTTNTIVVAAFGNSGPLRQSGGEAHVVSTTTSQ